MSAGVAALIAHVSFWVLLVYGWFWDELGPRGITIFLALWLAAATALPYMPFASLIPMSSVVAILDVALVFIIFKGDVRLS